MPMNDLFGPFNAQMNEADMVSMTVDEYETIRLIDLEGFTQEECAKQMDVARTTVQGIYIDARKKLAQSLVNGKVIRIEGGDYKLCGNVEKPCHGGGGCHKRRCKKSFSEEDGKCEA
jgi:predicted DNA-binding protein (UPF0251 family)